MWHRIMARRTLAYSVRAQLTTAGNMCVGQLQFFTTLHMNMSTSDLKTAARGLSLAVQWLRLHTFNTEGMGSIPGQRRKISYALCCA